MIIGIDLGTTNSLVAIWRDGTAHAIPNALGDRLTPSVVGIDENGQMLVGMPARDRLLTHPSLTAATFKRYMGSTREIRLGDRTFRSEELSSFVLRALKADAEAFLGEPVTEAVITVPAYFSDAQRKATRVAGQLAGLKVERLLNEPTAAALAYGLHEKDTERKFLVFDLGGGTFDVSILELFEGVMEVRASAGDNFLGGEDFVELLIDAFISDVGKSAGIHTKNESPAIYQQMRDQAERAKRKLSDSNEATIQLRHNGKLLEWTVTAERFVEISAPLLERLRLPIERALRDARIRSNELNNIVLAGGATRMPMVRSLVARMFGRFPIINLNPDEIVALGSAVQAGLKQRDASLNEVVMTDVCPYTLGIEICEYVGQPNQFRPGHYLPVIERNTVVPASRSKSISTIMNRQQELRVRIFQGEGRMVRDNIFLGELRVPVPLRRAGEVSCEVRFTYDINGLLEVETILPETNVRQRLVIQENPGVLSPDEIERRFNALALLKIHPRDDTENRAFMARADKLYEQLLGEARDYLAHQISQFTAILERQDPREINEARNLFKQILDKIEGTPYL